MIEPNTNLKITDILTETQKILEESDYTVKREIPHLPLLYEFSLLAEDSFGVVGVFIYSTVKELINSWLDAQSILVELLGTRLRKNDPKIREGYLVLLSPFLSDINERNQINKIRYDTSRIRKIVAVGEELSTLSDIKMALLPLLNLFINKTQMDDDPILDSLPDLLSSYGQKKEHIECIIKSYKENRPLISDFHKFRKT